MELSDQPNLKKKKLYKILILLKCITSYRNIEYVF